MKYQGFNKRQRLIKNAQFKAVLDQRRRLSKGPLILYTAGNDCPHARLGISIGRSHGNAVQRNRIKRAIREVFRQHQQEIPSGYDYLVTLSRRGAHPMDLDPVALQTAFVKLVRSLDKT